MHAQSAMAQLSRLIVCATMSIGACIFAQAVQAVGDETVGVRAAGFELGAEKSVFDGTNHLTLVLDSSNQVTLPFNQSAIKQSSQPARFGPNPEKPYFTVRFALPIPPENGTNLDAAIAGIDPMVFTHNHSPGFEILPNGDAFAIYFSTPPGLSEADPATSFIQARLRYGSEDWDLPELFFKTENYNDQSGLLWNDGGTIRFFGGGRKISDLIPFREATSTNNGATWTL